MLSAAAPPHGNVANRRPRCDKPEGPCPKKPPPAARVGGGRLVLRGSSLARMGSRSSGSHARCGHEVWAVRLDLNHAAGVGMAWRARWWERLARYLGKKAVIMSPRWSSTCFSLTPPCDDIRKAQPVRGWGFSCLSGACLGWYLDNHFQAWFVCPPLIFRCLTQPLVRTWKARPNSLRSSWPHPTTRSWSLDWVRKPLCAAPLG